MKIAVIIVRSLMGLLFAFASITFFLKMITPPPATGAMKIFGEGLEASVYIMPTVKAIELICAIAFLSGRFVPLAAVVIFPIVVNILLIHVFIAPEGLVIGAALMLANLFVVYYHRECYKPMFKAKS
jgi:putative oxidoreductase